MFAAAERGHLFSGCGHVVEIVRPHLWQPRIRVHIEVVPWREHWDVRMPQADSEEEWLLLFAREESARIVNCPHVAVLLLPVGKHAPIELALEIIQAVERMAGRIRNLLHPRIPLLPAVPRVVKLLKLEIVPLVRWVESSNVMEYLAGPRCVIAVFAKILRQGDRVRKRRPPPLLVVVNAGACWTPAG